MNGGVIPNTPIAVDFWKLRECPQARLFFLTHLHGDHISGLTSSWSYPVYCSQVTATLLRERHGVKEELICPLQLDSSHIIYLDNERTEQMTVTPIDANHCPGAVMFLFQGYFGTILHTGDFRFTPDMITRPPLMQLSGKIDTMYLDNTYNSSACRFPSREEATNTIIGIVESHPTHDIVLGLRSLGKEDLLCKIALACHEWISVPPRLYRTLQLMNAPKVVVNDDSTCRIRVVAFNNVSNKFVEKLNKTRPTIAILPTAIYCGIDAKPYENQDKVYVVPYSDHSSYLELVSFVSCLKPCKIIPVVKARARGPFGVSIADRADMSVFDKYTTKDVATTVSIPETVTKYMKSTSRCMYLAETGTFGKGVKRKPKQQMTHKSAKIAKRGVIYDSPGKNNPNHDEVESVSPRKGHAQLAVAREQTVSAAICSPDQSDSQETDTQNNNIEIKDIPTVDSSQGFNVNQQTNEMFTAQSQGVEVNDETSRSSCEEDKLIIDENYVSADEDLIPDNDVKLTDNEDEYDTASEHSSTVQASRIVADGEGNKSCEQRVVEDYSDNGSVFTGKEETENNGQIVEQDRNAENVVSAPVNVSDISAPEFVNILKQNQSGNNVTDRSKRLKPPLDFIGTLYHENEEKSSSKGIINYFHAELAKYNTNITHHVKRKRNTSQIHSSKHKIISESILSTKPSGNELCKTSHIASNSESKQTESKSIKQVENNIEHLVYENNENLETTETISDKCLKHPTQCSDDNIRDSQLIVIEDSSSANCNSEPIDVFDQETLADKDVVHDICAGVSRCNVYIRGSNSNNQNRNMSTNDVSTCEHETNDNSEESQSLLDIGAGRPTVGRTNNKTSSSMSVKICEEYDEKCGKKLEENELIHNSIHDTVVQKLPADSSNTVTSEVIISSDTPIISEVVSVPPPDNSVHEIEDTEDIHVSGDHGTNTILHNSEGIDHKKSDVDILFESQNSSETFTESEDMTQAPQVVDIVDTSSDRVSASTSHNGRKLTFNVIGVQYRTKEYKMRKFYRTLNKCISKIR